ncbi:bacterial Ig-like domain-containing protein [Eubacterium aggregans]|uniref:bacterial Ig-like domain-containing protein n=1 Tax=Eubacterium aggregans TaxID=81409 RepID=UPI003F36F65D
MQAAASLEMILKVLVRKKTVTISYGGASTAFDIAVTEAQLTGISLSKTPQTTFYKGEAFNTTGGQITATYTDGTTKEIALTVDMCSGYNTMNQGVQTVTVSYTEGNITKTGTYNITVGAPIVVSIKMGKLPNKTTYVQGNTFSAEGGTFIRLYSDGMESEPLALEYTDNDNKVYDYCSDPNMNQLGQQDGTVTDPEYKGTHGEDLITTFASTINEPSDDDVKKIIEALDNEVYDNNNFWPSQTVYYYYHHWINGSERRTTAVPLDATCTSVYDGVFIWRDYYGKINQEILIPIFCITKSIFEKKYNWAIVPNNYEGGYNPSVKTSDADTYGYTIYVYKGDISAVTVGDSVQVTTYSTIHPTGDGYGSALIKVAQSKNTKYLDVKSAVSWMYFNPIEDGKMLDAI